MYLNLDQFLKYKVHIGHYNRATKFYSSWFLYKIQKNVWIINIFKTIMFLKNIIVFIKYLINFNLPIWFINLEMTKELMFLMYSKLCGEFACTRYWIRGMLSNYISVSKSIRKYGSKKYVYKSSVFLKIANNWHITRYSWPRAIIISNIDNNYIVCKEALLMLMPLIAIIDTNVRNYLIKLPILSNDDCLESFHYIFNIITKLILLLKYKKLILWFSNYKQIKQIKFNNLINFTFLKKKINFNIFKFINFSDLLNINLTRIEIFNKINYNFVKENKKGLIFFDFKLYKKKKFYRNFLFSSVYKYKFIFKNKLKFYILDDINKILYNLKNKRNRRFIKLNKIFKYFNFFFSFLIYSIKYSKIFYNSFLKRNYKKVTFFDLMIIRDNMTKEEFELKELYKINEQIKKKKQIWRKPVTFVKIKNFKFFNLKYFFFPYFFFIKKRNTFYKQRKFKVSKLSNNFSNKLFLNYYNKFNFYIKKFIELYYNKWLINLLNIY